MKNTLLRKKYPHLLHCIALAAGGSIAIFIFFVVKSQGVFALLADFNNQQIPFTINLHKQLANGLDSWVWNYELGHSLIKAFSFSAVGSPFFYLSMLAPAEAFPYVVAWIYCVKYVAAAAISYFYFVRFLRDDRYAVLAALLYAFSGFQTVNLVFYSFHDVVALFPLMLIGLEKTMENRNNKAFFAFAVFVNCLVNYFFFVQEVLFLLLYFICRFWCRDFAELLRRIGACLICGILGVGMACVIFLPNVLYMLLNPRMSVEAEGIKLFYNLKELLFVVKGMLLPAESMFDNSALMQESYLSVSCYMPMVGLVPALAYVRRNRDWLSGLMICCVVISLVPVLSSAFMLFTEVYYRWWYMFALVLALAAAKVFDNSGEYKIFTSAVIFCTGIFAFGLVVLAIDVLGEEAIVFHRVRLATLCAMSMAGAAATVLACRRKNRAVYLCLGAVLFGVINSVGMVSTYRIYKGDTSKSVLNSVELGSQLELIDPQYRYDLTYNNIVMMAGEGSDLNIFSSTRNEGSIAFDGLFEYFMGFNSMNKSTVEGLENLLGGKYYISEQTDGSHVRQYSTGSGEYYVMEKTASPIGFAMDKFILMDDFGDIPVPRRGVILLQAAVVDEEYADKLEPYASREDAFTLRLDAEPDALSHAHQAAAVTDFSRDSEGFSCSSDFEKGTLVYFSVPNDNGWTAYVDGEETEIIPSGGMMLLALDAGHHEIEFEYSTPGYKAGLTVSLLSFAVFALLLLMQKKNLNKNN